MVFNLVFFYAAADHDSYTHYQANLSNIAEYVSALTNAIEKIGDPNSTVLAISEINTYSEWRESVSKDWHAFLQNNMAQNK
jgi:uncharacterized protein YkvS